MMSCSQSWSASPSVGLNAVASSVHGPATLSWIASQQLQRRAPTPQQYGAHSTAVLLWQHNPALALQGSQQTHLIPAACCAVTVFPLHTAASSHAAEAAAGEPGGGAL
jgi:hypothetical protein